MDYYSGRDKDKDYKLKIGLLYNAGTGNVRVIQVTDPRRMMYLLISNVYNWEDVNHLEQIKMEVSR
jgi:hypothetical protein